MTTKELINDWFEKWEKGDFMNIPISEDFSHASPFGTIDGKESYLSIVKENQDKFLGYRFEIEDALFDRGKACVRYKAIQGDFKLDVSEWYYIRDNQIEKIISHYHIGEIRDERKLSGDI